MSFWPRLRRRSRKRKRSSSAPKTNPYATRDVDKYNVVHAESQAQRAQFASEKGVSIELVRFVSRSSRGWVYLPSEAPSSSTTPRSSHDGDVTIASPAHASQEFFLSPPTLPLPAVVLPSTRRDEETKGSSQQEGESSSTGNVGVDARGSSRRVGRLVISRKLKDEAWVQISKTAAVLFVKVLVFSHALGASTAVAFTIAVVVDIWNRGKGTFHRVFSSLATQLLTTLKPYLSLHPRKSSSTLARAAPKPASQSLTLEQLSVSNAMKVSPITEDSPGQERRSSSSPVLTKDSCSAGTRFHADEREGNPSPSGSLVELDSPLPSPLVERNKLPSSKPHQKLKSKLFKCSPRNGENSSPSTDVAQWNDAASSSGVSSYSSPAREKNTKKQPSCISRKSSNSGEEDFYEGDQPKSSLKTPKKITRSHELLFFRSPNYNRRKESGAHKEIEVVSAVPPAGAVNLSRSQELKFSMKSFGKKKVSRSQEFTTRSPPPVQNLELPKFTVEGLEALAFPFKVDGQVQQEERPSVVCSPRQSPGSRRCSLSKLMAGELVDDKHSSRALDSVPSSPGASSAGGVKGLKSITTASSCSTSVSSSKAASHLAAAELKPELQRVRTAVPAVAEHQGSDGSLQRAKTAMSKSPLPPSQGGELGRSQVLSREILGSILLLAVLGFLLLGRISAIFYTSCLCLTLSHLQRVFDGNVTPRDQELLKRSSGISRLHHASPTPVHWPNGNSSHHGSPINEKSGLQSSDYRKKVLIEGLLDRGNRRGSAS